MRAPVLSESGIDSGQGVTITLLAMRRCAARMSDSVTSMRERYRTRGMRRKESCQPARAHGPLCGRTARYFIPIFLRFR